MTGLSISTGSRFLMQLGMNRSNLRSAGIVMPMHQRQEHSTRTHNGTLTASGHSFSEMDPRENAEATTG